MQGVQGSYFSPILPALFCSLSHDSLLTFLPFPSTSFTTGSSFTISTITWTSFHLYFTFVDIVFFIWHSFYLGPISCLTDKIIVSHLLLIYTWHTIMLIFSSWAYFKPVFWIFPLQVTIEAWILRRWSCLMIGWVKLALIGFFGACN